MTELELGNYEFYPYELNDDEIPSLEELMRRWAEMKTKPGKGVRDGSWLNSRKRPRPRNARLGSGRVV